MEETVSQLIKLICLSGELFILLQEELHLMVSVYLNFFMFPPATMLNNTHVVFGALLRLEEYVQGISGRLPATEASSVLSAPHLCAFMRPYPACIG